MYSVHQDTLLLRATHMCILYISTCIALLWSMWELLDLLENVRMF